MKTPNEILDTLGRDAVAVAIGVNKVRVNRAALDEKLPAVWYAKLSELHGSDLPRDVFRFKGYAT